MAHTTQETGGLRAMLYRQLEPAAWPHRGLSPLNLCLAILVFVSLITYALETEDTISPMIQAGIEHFNWSILIIFAMEYVARLWVEGEDPRYRGLGGRIRYMFTPYALADLIAFLPEMLFLLLMSSAGSESSVAALKALRLLRLLKIARFIPAFDVLGAALRRAGTQLLTTLALALALVYLSAMLLYFIEGQDPTNADSYSAFGSIPRAIWWAIATLTTVGYGDVYPVTALGRVAASMIALAGIGVVALPAGIFAGAFADELAERNAARKASDDPPPDPDKPT